jgi:hypothetical protein
MLPTQDYPAGARCSPRRVGSVSGATRRLGQPIRPYAAGWRGNLTRTCARKRPEDSPLGDGASRQFSPGWMRCRVSRNPFHAEYGASDQESRFVAHLALDSCYLTHRIKKHLTRMMRCVILGAEMRTARGVLRVGREDLKRSGRR